MASEISYFVLFGIMIFANGSPAYREDLTQSEVINSLKYLVDYLSKQFGYEMVNDNYDEVFVDETRVNQGLNESQPNSNKLSLTKTPGIFQILKNIESLRASENNEKNSDNRSKKDCVKELGTCTELTWPFKNKTELRTYLYSDDAGEIREFLKELDNELGLTDNNKIILNELEYNSNYNDNNNRENVDNFNEQGYKVYKQNYANHNQHLRCIGDRCSRATEDNINDDIDETDILRCIGDRCSKFNSDNRDSIDALRCIRDRCMTDFSESLRCVGNRCGRNRNIDSDTDSSDDDTDDDDDDDDDSDSDDDVALRLALAVSKLGLNNERCSGKLCARYNDNRNHLRCVGNRCARDRDDDVDKDFVDKTILENLRCIGNRCNRDKDDDNDNTNVGRCSEDRCGRSRNDDADSYATNSKKDEEILSYVDTLITNVLAKHLRANRVLQDDDVAMILNERTKIMQEIKNILEEIKHE